MTFPGPLLESREFGDWRIHAIQASGQQLDGGAMFGVVPKPLWERRLPADKRNRIQLGMRCLLIEHGSELVLIDTGVGNKESAKFHEIYGIENRTPGTPDDGSLALLEGMREAGFGPDDITVVINTHLHFDHAGGNTSVGAEGQVSPTFPNATYVVQQGELDFATNANERTSASYFPANWDSIRLAKKLKTVKGDMELYPGISLRRTPGHTPHHQSVILRSGGETSCFLGDLVPTAHHLPLPWIMGYDVEPLVTLETKRRLLGEALDENWLLIFEHDAHHGFGRLAHDGKNFALTLEPRAETA